MPALEGVLETVLYVDDFERARAFYEGLFGLASLYSDQRMCAYDVGGRSVLLLFRRGESLHTIKLPGGVIPPHDGRGPHHIAFSITAGELADWEARLGAFGIEIEGRTRWPRGGISIYFRDPDGHLLELATPGLWPGH
jgi:catechol 2,3-dioxygenase-like lactoylglutathione lyase family enzyme